MKPKLRKLDLNDLLNLAIIVFLTTLFGLNCGILAALILGLTKPAIDKYYA